MVELRACDQCGTEFTPRREHARFCSAGCRLAWNRGDSRQAIVSVAALDWAVNAMIEATSRLGAASALGMRHAAVTVSEATWWVTLVDATLVRYFPGGYDALLDAQPAPRRAEIENTLAGLRYVRNQMGVHLDPGEFLCAAPDGGAGRAGLTWTWSALPEPVTEELSPRGKEWERSRYRAYQNWLSGRAIPDTFALAAQFLTMAAQSFPPQSCLGYPASRTGAVPDLARHWVSPSQ